MKHYQTVTMRKGFTLIEMLVVLLIIGLLAAILFPVVNGAKEKAYQSSCATNLHQIYLAVRLYKEDEGGFPESLAALLPDTDDLAKYAGTSPDFTGSTASLNAGGKGYFKGGLDALICSDDDTLPITDSSGKALTRSSYGDTSVDISAGPQGDFGRFVWNYWGYRAKDDTGTCTADVVSGCMGTAYSSDPLEVSGTHYADVFSDARYRVDTSDASSALDVTKLPRLANRFALSNTIITHCVYHRLPTSNVAGPYDVYSPDGKGARDIILRLDGSTKTLDVTADTFTSQEGWAKQNF